MNDCLDSLEYITSRLEDRNTYLDEVVDLAVKRRVERTTSVGEFATFIYSQTRQERSSYDTMHWFPAQKELSFDGKERDIYTPKGLPKYLRVKL